MKHVLFTLLLATLCATTSFGQTIKTLGYNVSNNQVVFTPTNTNSLTFLKNIQIKGSDTTNIPTLFWQTSDGVGDGSMLAFSRRHATNLWFGINQTNWSQGVWGQNIQPTADGNNFTRKNTNFGSVALVLENEYNAEQNTNNPSRTVAEMYFDIIDTSGQRTRPLMFVGSQTNSALGWGYSVYPLTIGVTNLGWNAASALMVEFNNAGGGGTAVIKNMATNGGSYAELQFVNSANSTIFYAKQNKFEIYGNHSPSYHILQAVTNGVIIGGAFSSSAAQRVQLGGNTRIDGAISFNATTNADITRTNLGLGNGITATNTFVSYNGTNYTTNTVTMSNGIITGWTQ
jgi:hypothetical protein